MIWGNFSWKFSSRITNKITSTARGLFRTFQLSMTEPLAIMFDRVCLSLIFAKSRVFYKKKLFLKFRNIHMQTPVLEYLFNKVVRLRNFLKNTHFEEHLRTAASKIVSSGMFEMSYRSSRPEVFCEKRCS